MGVCPAQLREQARATGAGEQEELVEAGTALVGDDPAVVAEELVRPARLVARAAVRGAVRPHGKVARDAGRGAGGAVALVARLQADAAVDLALDREVPLCRGAEAVILGDAAQAGDL